ncbi:hypothetical protein N9Y87_02450 [Planktomarina temperata]|jgi:hypothetical protein|nr:hypothetical protein [Planktomarina temperata]
MKKAINLALILFGVSFYLMNISKANATSCTSTSTRSDHASSATTSHPLETVNFCSVNAESIILKIYEFGLCTGPSNLTDSSACTTLFQSSNGQDLDLTVGSNVSLINEISLSEGFYTNAYLKVSDVISIKAIVEFADARVSNPATGLGDGSGKFCFTDGRSINDISTIVTCANTKNGADITSEKMYIGYYDSGGSYVSGEIPNYQTSLGGVVTETDLYTYNNQGAFESVRANAIGIYADQTLAAPVKIDANTSNIDLGIVVTDGVSLGFRCENDAASEFSSAPDWDKCVSDVSFNGLRFAISAQ